MNVVDLLYRLSKCLDNIVVFKKIVQHALTDVDKANIFRHTIADPELTAANEEMLKSMLMSDETLWQRSPNASSLRYPAVSWLDFGAHSEFIVCVCVCVRVCVCACVCVSV